MESRPPALIEALVGRLIPPASREPVLGDLHERYTGASRYVRDTLRIAPRLVVAQMLRVVRGNYMFLAAEIGIFVITSFGWSGLPLHGTPPTLRWVLPAAVTFLVLLVRDAYVDVDGVFATADDADQAFESGLARAVKDVLIAVTLGWGAELVVRRVAIHAAMPLGALATASGAWLLMLGAMRAAWWTVYVPGTQRMRLAALPRDRALTASEVAFRYRWLRQTSLGPFAWLVVILPFVKMLVAMRADEPVPWLSLREFTTVPFVALVHVWFLVVLGVLSWRVCRGAWAGMRRQKIPFPATPVEYREAVRRQRAILDNSRLRLWMLAAIGPAIVTPIVDSGYSFASMLPFLMLTGCSLSLAAEISSRTAKRLQEELDALDG